jgi:hypothetical protein
VPGFVRRRLRSVLSFGVFYHHALLSFLSK